MQGMIKFDFWKKNTYNIQTTKQDYESKTSIKVQEEISFKNEPRVQ